MQSFLISLLICSVTMSALALFYMAVTPLLARRYSSKSRYYSWLIIVMGLIIPFRPQFRHSIVKVDMPYNAAIPFIRLGNGAPAAAPAVEHTLTPSLPAAAWWQIGAAVWLAGMAVFLVYHIIKHWRFLRLVSRWSDTITDPHILMLLQNQKAQMGLSRHIGLQLCSCIGSPMMIGFANPRILLPNTAFADDELRFILRHELVHYKRKDLWYKGLVLIAAAVHWFNPIVHLLGRAIDILCELSCDEEVVSGAGADARQTYCETIIGVIRYQSKLKTALSTNFYGGKKGMKNRIFSIMDMGRKKTGIAVVCGALTLTLGTGIALAASGETQNPPSNTLAAPWISVGFMPDPVTYAKYAEFGITISDDGTKLLYKGQPVRLFADDRSETEAFYLDGAGDLNLSAVRNAAGEITGIEAITARQAQQYQDTFFADELANAQEKTKVDVNVQEAFQVGTNKYGQYQAFGITYSEADNALYFKGQRVKFFIDQSASGEIDTMWEDEAGTVNLEVNRSGSDQITGIETISDARVKTYLSAADEYEQNILNGLEEKVEKRMKEKYSEN